MIGAHRAGRHRIDIDSAECYPLMTMEWQMYISICPMGFIVMKCSFRNTRLVLAIVSLLSVCLWFAHPIIHADGEEHHHDCVFCQVMAHAGVLQPDGPPVLTLPVLECVPKPVAPMPLACLFCKRADLIRGPPSFEL